MLDLHDFAVDPSSVFILKSLREIIVMQCNMRFNSCTKKHNNKTQFTFLPRHKTYNHVDFTMCFELMYEIFIETQALWIHRTSSTWNMNIQPNKK